MKTNKNDNKTQKTETTQKQQNNDAPTTKT